MSLTPTPAVDVARDLDRIAGAAGLPAQTLTQVFELVAAAGALPRSQIMNELEWFCGGLGLEPRYFSTTEPEVIAQQIQALYAGKILARSSGEDAGLQLSTEREGRAMFTCRDEHEVALQLERRIDEGYSGHRLQSYRTSGTTAPDSASHLRLYLLQRPTLQLPCGAGETALERIAARELLDSVGPTTKARYQALVDRAAQRLGVCVELVQRPDKQAKQLVLVYRSDTVHSLLCAVSDLLNAHCVTSQRKYVEPLANGMAIFSITVADSVPDAVLETIRAEVDLLYVLPRTALTPLHRSGQLTVNEVVYAYAGWKFAHQFLSRYREEVQTLAAALAGDARRLGLLSQMRHQLSRDTFTEDRIFETIVAHPQLMREFFADFAAHHQGGEGAPARAPNDPEHDAALQRRVNQMARSTLDRMVLSAFLTFNRHVLATNFFKESKTALAFRLDAAFLSAVDYPEQPFGIYFLVGSEFRGFHVRFRDVARGGIRIIRSPNAQSFKTNIDRLFNENYQLALTQQRKNKDIPEGGAKGTILLSLEYQERGAAAFKKYVDGLLDLLLPHPQVVNHLGRQELLFLGPDEGTAELMDWASAHARRRGYPFWRAITTGKSPGLGGIPHDLYGMTTRSVHQYVVGALQRMGLDESSVTKLQTGGPDGDLGSNEIKISTDRTLAVVDGSGVAYDPGGLDRRELLRLAQARRSVRHFDRKLLGQGGFLVTVGQRDVTLPDGTHVESGHLFRDTFHLNPLATAQLFVPCGGRPDAVHINNVERLFDGSGTPRFALIVEGANLFFTQEARLALERAGAVLFKDASANKGGVISSSLEVLAALALEEQDFQQQMVVRDEQPTAFYRSYVEQVQQHIERTARLEFACLWDEHQRSGAPISELSDQLSERINRLNDAIQASRLWDNAALRRRVLAAACPAVLLERVGLARLLERAPEAYLQAVFGAHLASQYLYSRGLAAGEVEFVEFLDSFLLGS